MGRIVHEEGDRDRDFVARELTSRLREFNESAVGPLNSKLVVLSMRDDRGALIGGLSGEVFWNAFLIDLLWVDEPHRDRGHGSSLLRSAEAIATREHCQWVYLSTFSFQAPAFYSRQGYKLMGELTDVPYGSRRQWFCKAVGNNAI